MESSPTEQIEHLCVLARERINTGDFDGARSYLLTAQEVAGEAPPPEMLRLLGSLTAELQDFPSGVLFLEKALDGFRLAEDHLGEAMSAADLAALLQRYGSLGRAWTLIKWALEHVDTEDDVQQSRLLNITATVAAFQGRLEDAVAFLVKARPLANRRIGCWIELNIATALSNLGRHAEAQQALINAVAALPQNDGYTPLMLDFERTWCEIVSGNHAVA